MPEQPILIVDIDGVVADEPFKGAVYSPEGGWDYTKCIVLEGGKEAMIRYTEWGYFIHFFTARWVEDYDVTFKWLKDNGIPFGKLQCGKPRGAAYIDDRAIEFKHPRNGGNRVQGWDRVDGFLNPDTRDKDILKEY